MAATVSVSPAAAHRGVERQAQVIGAEDTPGGIVLRDGGGRDRGPRGL